MSIIVIEPGGVFAPRCINGHSFLQVKAHELSDSRNLFLLDKKGWLHRLDNSIEQVDRPVRVEGKCGSCLSQGLEIGLMDYVWTLHFTLGLLKYERSVDVRRPAITRVGCDLAV